jgi:hypothetical protein
MVLVELCLLFFCCNLPNYLPARRVFFFTPIFPFTHLVHSFESEL